MDNIVMDSSKTNMAHQVVPHLVVQMDIAIQ